MKSHTRARAVIALWLIAAVPFCIAFTHYYDLSIADFLSSALKIEAPDELNLQQGLLDSKSKLITLNSFNFFFFPEPNCLLRFNRVCFQMVSHDQLTPVLRC